MNILRFDNYSVITSLNLFFTVYQCAVIYILNTQIYSTCYTSYYYYYYYYYY